MPPATERKALEEGLAHLNANMQSIAVLSEGAIRKAIEGLLDPGSTDPKDVFDLDREIYVLQQVIEKTCVDLIALHAPVARDLRTITTSLRITNDLDRIGRYARDIVEITTTLGPASQHLPSKFAHLQRMADLTIHMVDTSTRAYVNRDAESVRDINRFDDAVDDMHDEILAELILLMEDRAITIPQGVSFVLINRYLERIADHAVNIGNRVVYMVTGEPPRRPGPHHSQAEPAPVPPRGSPSGPT